MIVQAIPPQQLASTHIGSFGIPVNDSTTRKPAAMSSAGLFDVSCPINSSPMFVCDEVRVVSSPAASEMMNAGIWLTSPSPMVSLVNVLKQSVIGQPYCSIPMAMPPRALTNVMRMPAMASPRTNFEAPSIAP